MNEQKMPLSPCAENFFREMESKGIVDLSKRVKEAMASAGFACRANLYNIREDDFPAVFEKIQEMFDFFPDFKPQLSTTDKKQIRFLSKYITAELDKGIFSANPSKIAEF